MSQRLLLRREEQLAIEDDAYDLVLTDTTNQDAVRDLLRREYFGDHGLGYYGPWKIQIADVATYQLHEQAIREVFDHYGETYPACVWAFYAPGRDAIEHPTEDELARWMGEMVSHAR